MTGEERLKRIGPALPAGILDDRGVIFPNVVVLPRRLRRGVVAWGAEPAPPPAKPRAKVLAFRPPGMPPPAAPPAFPPTPLPNRAPKPPPKPK